MKTRHTASATFIPMFLAIMLGLTACATIDQKVDLNYSSQNPSSVKHTGNINVSAIESKKYSKNPSGEWIIGSFNNNHGVHQADLLSDRTLGDWVSAAMIHDLRQAGYNASTSSAPHSASDHGIVISDIDMVFNINKGVFTSDSQHSLKFNVTIFKNGIKARSFSIASRDDRLLPLSFSKENAENILLHSLQDAMLQIIPDIIVLIEKK